jgi:DoxX-like family
MPDISVSPSHTASPNRLSVGAGWTVSGLLILFLILDAGLKIAGLPIVAETVAALGWTPDLGFWRGMGLLLLVLTALYAWPRTAVLGAILLTAYFGGAIATHARIGSPLLSHTLFGVYLGVMAWAGLWLRDPQIRVLLPMR